MRARVPGNCTPLLAAALLAGVGATATAAPPAAEGTAAAESAATTGTVAGTLTVDGKPAALGHGFAYAKAGSFDESKDDVVVVLTDQPLSPSEQREEGERLMLAAKGKLAVLELTFDAEGKFSSKQILYSGASLSGSGSDEALEKVALGRGRIVGKAATKATSTVGKWTYAFDVSFDLPVKPRKPPTTAAEAAAIEASEQGKVVTAYLKAIRAGDVAAIKALVQPEMAKRLEGPEGKDTLELLQAMMLEKPTFTDLSIDGDRATVTLVQKEGTSTTTNKVRLVKSGEAWKVGK